MADMGTKEAAELWGVEQWKVQKWCRKCGDKKVNELFMRIIQVIIQTFNVAGMKL